ncbi:MAG: S8 family serine peptidase [Nitrospirae bacterium]|nr:S8 family serine peptidase [Nitrospirota bacterium]
MIINKLRNPLFLLPGLVILLFGVPGPVSAGMIDPVLKHELQSRGPQDEVPVIVKAVGYAPLDLVHASDKGVRRSRIIKALRSTADLPHQDIKEFSMMKGVRNLHSLWIVNSTALSASADVIRELAALPQVESITLDALIHAPVTNAGIQATPEWNISAVHAPELWSLGHTGTGIVVASMDSGVDGDHPDLQSKWRGGTNSWFDPNGQHALPTDVLGHGTQTMGIMVGGDAGGTSIGVAPGAQWIAVKIFNDAGSASYSAIHQGFQWLLDPDNNPDTDDAPDVVNNSWGLTDPNHGCITEFQQDLQALKAAGIALTFSAGNDGPGSATSLSPANYPESFSVGAVDNTNTIISSSSRGPSACDGGIFPYVVAPGADILTTDLYFGIPGAYAAVSGTSFAAPHAAGVMALLMGAFPALDVTMLETALANSSTDMGLPGPDNAYGLGLINVLNAYAYLNGLAIPLPAPSSQLATLLGGPLRVQLTGQDNATNETGFVIERSTNDGSFVVIATPGPFSGTGTMTYLDRTVKSGNTYTYRMKAVNGTLSSAYSNTASVTVPTPPAAPSSLAGEAVRITRSTTQDVATLAWIDNAINESAFTVQRSLNAAFTNSLRTFTVGADVNKFSQKVSRANNFYYRVRATNVAGKSGWSNTVFVTTP